MSPLFNYTDLYSSGIDSTNKRQITIRRMVQAWGLLGDNFADAHPWATRELIERGAAIHRKLQTYESVRCLQTLQDRSAEELDVVYTKDHPILNSWLKASSAELFDEELPLYCIASRIVESELAKQMEGWLESKGILVREDLIGSLQYWCRLVARIPENTSTTLNSLRNCLENGGPNWVTEDALLRYLCLEARVVYQKQISYAAFSKNDLLLTCGSYPAIKSIKIAENLAFSWKDKMLSGTAMLLSLDDEIDDTGNTTYCAAHTGDRFVLIGLSDSNCRKALFFLRNMLHLANIELLDDIGEIKLSKNNKLHKRIVEWVDL